MFVILDVAILYNMPAILRNVTNIKNIEILYT